MRFGLLVFLAFATIAVARDIPLPEPATQATQSAPAAAFNGSTGLAAWSETGGDGMGRIVVARFASDGTFLDARAIEIAAGVTPAVATDGRDFLVVWRDELVHAVLVRADGTVGTVRNLSSEEGSSAPHVAFDTANYFVVWDDGEGNELRHLDASRVNRNGQMVDAFPLELESGTNPSVAFDGTNHWLIYAQFGRIVARRMSPDGSTVGGSFVVDSAATDTSRTAISCVNGTCLATWNRTGAADDSDLFAAILTSNQIRVFPIATFNVQLAPAIAGNENGFLITWPESNGSDLDIRAARVSLSGELQGIFTVASTGLDEPSAVPIVFNGKSAVIYSRNGNGSALFTYRLILRTDIPENRRHAVRR